MSRMMLFSVTEYIIIIIRHQKQKKIHTTLHRYNSTRDSYCYSRLGNLQRQKMKKRNHKIILSHFISTRLISSMCMTSFAEFFSSCLSRICESSHEKSEWFRWHDMIWSHSGANTNPLKCGLKLFLVAKLQIGMV